MHWVIDGVLARTNRPGRYSSDPSEVPKAEVTRWLDDVIDHGAKSVICLLHCEEIGEYYPDCDLLEEYKQRGLNVRNVQVVDHKSPPLTATERDEVWAAFEELPKPVVVHCSAGVSRTGVAVELIADHISQEDAEFESDSRTYP